MGSIINYSNVFLRFIKTNINIVPPRTYSVYWIYIGFPTVAKLRKLASQFPAGCECSVNRKKGFLTPCCRAGECEISIFDNISYILRSHFELTFPYWLLYGLRRTSIMEFLSLVSQPHFPALIYFDLIRINLPHTSFCMENPPYISLYFATYRSLLG